MHMPQSRTMRFTSALMVSPASIFFRASGSAVTSYCENGEANLPYQTFVTPLILPGIASLARKKPFQSAGVASLMEVKAKQCISFLSPAFAAAVQRRTAAKAAIRTEEDRMAQGYYSARLPGCDRVPKHRRRRGGTVPKRGCHQAAT